MQALGTDITDTAQTQTQHSAVTALHHTNHLIFAFMALIDILGMISFMTPAMLLLRPPVLAPEMGWGWRWGWRWEGDKRGDRERDEERREEGRHKEGK